MNINASLRVIGSTIVMCQAVSGLAFAMNLAAPMAQMAPAACLPAMDLPTGHDNLVDINTAPRDWLVWVGINEALAAKIIGNRPYHARIDLLNKGILSREIYDKVKNRIIARQV